MTPDELVALYRHMFALRLQNLFELPRAPTSEELDQILESARATTDQLRRPPTKEEWRQIVEDVVYPGFCKLGGLDFQSLNAAFAAVRAQAQSGAKK